VEGVILDKGEAVKNGLMRGVWKDSLNCDHLMRLM
jgi:hypothetical protein